MFFCIFTAYNKNPTYDFGCFLLFIFALEVFSNNFFWQNIFLELANILDYSNLDSK